MRPEVSWTTKAERDLLVDEALPSEALRVIAAEALAGRR